MNNNKLIAEFMGIVYPKLDNVIVIDNVVIKEDDLQYHESWDWLMPVIDKCYQEHMSKHIADAVMTCDKDKAYQAVIEFINEYNKIK